MTLDVCTLCYLKHVLVSGGEAFRLPVSLHQPPEKDPAANREKKKKKEGEEEEGGGITEEK